MRPFIHSFAVLLLASTFTGAAAMGANSRKEDTAASAISQPTRTTDTTGWYEWAFDSGNAALDSIDLSGLNETPAGNHGFMKVSEEGHYKFEDGTPVRFFGTSFGGSNCCPDKKTAEITAERLAKYGMNLARLHCPDSDWSPLIDYKKGTSRELNAQALDRYDYFFAQLKKHGIYVYVDLLDYRQFMPGDGVKDAEQMGAHWVKSMKAASMFDERLLELQKGIRDQTVDPQEPLHGSALCGRPRNDARGDY